MRNVTKVLVALLVLAGSSLSATTLVPGDFTVMARESELIVHGTVVDVRAVTAGPKRTIESLITVQVANTIKGAAGEQTVFRVPGGQIGRYRRVMVGAPGFSRGDEVIVFLSGRAPSVPMPYGLSQGVYRVARRGGAATVSPLLESRPGRVMRGDPSRRAPDLSAFAGQVRAALSDSNAPPRRAIPRPR